MTLSRILLVDDDPVLLQVPPETLRLRMPELMIDTSLSGLRRSSACKPIEREAFIASGRRAIQARHVSRIEADHHHCIQSPLFTVSNYGQIVDRSGSQLHAVARSRYYSASKRA